MKLNKLGYQIIELNEESIKSGYFVDDEDFPGMLFELLIDGETISSLLNTKHKAIPYFYFENDFPKSERKERYLLAVCKCGVEGCGSVTFILEKQKDFVTFREIFNHRVELPKHFEFRFLHENYDAVIKEIIAKAGEYNKQYESQNKNYDGN
jgi:hypothetical protein